MANRQPWWHVGVGVTQIGGGVVNMGQTDNNFCVLINFLRLSAKISMKIHQQLLGESSSDREKQKTRG